MANVYKNWIPQGQKGEGNPQAVLTDEIVINIKIDLRDGMMVKKIAEKYGVSQTTISNIKAKRRWRHVVIPEGK